MTTNRRIESLEEFVKWTAGHIKGDEKGEAQIFLDRMFRGFGWPGLREANATCEERVKNDNGGTAFADMVWKPVVVIEMKKRGADLTKHYRQAFDYWSRLVPNRPRYAVLCNFDEFWVYDFDTQFDTPVDTVKLVDLPNRYGPLAFMFPGDVAPVFGNHQETVTRQAADKLAACFNSMIKRGIDRPMAQKFILQMLMGLFAEDIGLLEKYFVTRLLEDCKSPRDTYDLLGGLFSAMNTKGGTHGGRYMGVPYFNGGLFAEAAKVELVAEERRLLKEAAKFDWSKVRPEIFGTLFEHSLEKSDRHAYGAHFTSPADIMKIVGPTIVEPWRREIESATSLKDLKGLLNRIERFTVLDPACGSGNFLYVAYRELKRLEASIYERMALLFPKSVDPNQRPFGFVTARNFFGQDINPFAVDIAKVTMMLAHKLSIDELHINEEALPLDNLDSNFKACDALITSTGEPASWPKTDVIVGNPPFLGAKLLKPKLGVDYVRTVRQAYPQVPGMADFCVYWFRKAHDTLEPCTSADPLAGRAGLVGTQNVRNNASRIGGLEHIVQTGTLIEAVDNQPWSGEANVHVSIANWVKSQDPSVLPSKRRLWFKAHAANVMSSRAKRGAGPASKRFELDMREVRFISSSLSDLVDVSGANSLICNTKIQRVYQGLTPGHSGFVLDGAEAMKLVTADPASRAVIHPFIGGEEVLTSGAPERFIIDFGQRSILACQAFPAALKHVQALVLPARVAAAEKGKDAAGVVRSHHKQFLERWWQLSWGRAELASALEGMTRYLACSRVAKRPIFVFISSRVRPGDSMQVFVLEDDYSFGILQASPHLEWFVAKSSKLTERLRYTPESVFDTLPWPQNPTSKQIEDVSNAGRALRQVRDDALKGLHGGLRVLYRTLDLPGKNPLRTAHAELDTAVMAAYGFSQKKGLLQQLLELNQAVEATILKGAHAQGPGIPVGYVPVSKLMSDDCLGNQ